MSTQNICTPEELKEFAETSIITIDNLSKFIESKTNQKYIIVEREFIEDISQQLLNNMIYIFDINNFFNEAWEKIISGNQEINQKWQETLKLYKTK